MLKMLVNFWLYHFDSCSLARYFCRRILDSGMLMMDR